MKVELALTNCTMNIQKKNNNQFKNLLGYKYLLDIYNPKFEEIFAKIAPKPEEPKPQPPQTSQIDVQQPPLPSEQPQTDSPEPPQPPQPETTQPDLPRQNPPESPKTDDKKLEKLEKKIGTEKKDVVEKILEIIDKNFNSIRKKETVAKTANKIKAIILRELGRKK